MSGKSVFFIHPMDDEFLDKVVPYIEYRMRGYDVHFMNKNQTFDEVLGRVCSSDIVVACVDGCDPECMFVLGYAFSVGEGDDSRRLYLYSLKGSPPDSDRVRFFGLEDGWFDNLENLIEALEVSIDSDSILENFISALEEKKSEEVEKEAPRSE